MTRANKPEDFFRFVEPEPMSGCWLWTGALVRGGYGRFKIAAAHPLAHRFAYQQAVGAIPDGLTIDHRCRNRQCVNPVHLRVMPLSDNQRLGGNYVKMCCPRGHAYDRLQVTKTERRFRYCRICDNARSLRAYYRRRARL